MEDFPFDFNLSYMDQEYIVKPPANLFKLKELASKKYEIDIEEMVYIPENDEKMVINNEQDYLDLIQYVSAHNLIKKKTKMKKMKQIRKKRMKKKKKKIRRKGTRKGNIKEKIRSIIKGLKSKRELVILSKKNKCKEMKL